MGTSGIISPRLCNMLGINTYWPVFNNHFSLGANFLAHNSFSEKQAPFIVIIG
jgi:hypothetical protein